MIKLTRSKLLWLTGGLFLVALLSVTWLYLNPQKAYQQGFGGQSAGSLTFKAPDRAIINEPFDLTVLIDTHGSNINAAGIYIRFDQNKLQVLQMDTQASFCQFYPEKKFDNQLGSISLACGAPHPGVSGSSTMMVIKFMPVALGNSQIIASGNSQLLLSDGKGTNILKNYPSVSLSVVNNL